MRFAIWKSLIRQSIQSATAYKATTFLTVIFGFLFTSIELIAGSVFFGIDDNLFGWSLNNYQLLVVNAALITAGYQFLFVAAHESLAENIVEGQLDYVFLRPVNSYYFYAFGEIDIASGVNLLVYLAATITLLGQTELTLIQYVQSVGIDVLGIWFLFELNQVIVEISFWKDNLSALNGLPEYLFDAANRPTNIYPQAIKFLFMFVVPALTVTNGLVWVVQGKSAFWAICALVVFNIILTISAHALWHFGAKRYQSTN